MKEDIAEVSDADLCRMLLTTLESQCITEKEKNDFARLVLQIILGDVVLE